MIADVLQLCNRKMIDQHLDQIFLLVLIEMSYETLCPDELQ